MKDEAKKTDENPNFYHIWMSRNNAASMGGIHYTFLRGTTEKRPRKLTTKRNPIIHPNDGFLKSFLSEDSLAIRSLIPNR